MKHVSSLLTGALLSSAPLVVFAQPAASPYRTRLAVDAPITAGLSVMAGTGYLLMQRKRSLSPAEQAALSKQAVPKIDRFAAGNYSARAQQTGNVLTYGALLAAPGLLALDDGVRGRYGQVLGLYAQSLALTDALFTLTAGTVYRYRPLLYSAEAPAELRGDEKATESFFAGHTAHAATATFFAAKVFHDFNPRAAAGPWVWGAAAALPALVAATRIEAGKHFLTDNVVGYAVGAASGILVPHLHKTARQEKGRPVWPGAAAGAAAGVLLPVLRQQTRQGLSVLLLRGVNPNGYAYGGLGISKRL